MLLDSLLDYFRIQTTPLVGIDISSSSIKVLELSRSNNQYTVESYGIELLPPQIIVDKSIKDVNKVAESLKRLMNRVGATRKFGALAVAGSSVIVRTIQLNADYTEDKIAEQIEVEADRYIPYPLDEVYYDFEIIGPSAKHPELMDVLLAASRIENVETRVGVAAECGLKATIIDIEALAMERAFELVVGNIPEKGVGKNVALLDIGSTSTSLYVFQNLKTIYSRDQAFGGRHLTDEIQRRYGLSLDEAIAAQKFGGLPEDYNTEVLAPFKETVVQQINRGLQVFYSSSEETEVHYIVLAGGVSAMPGLDNLIQARLSIKTYLANPFAEMQVSSKVNHTSLIDDAPSLLLTCGLALRTFDNE